MPKRRRSFRDMVHIEEHINSTESDLADAMFHLSAAKGIIKKTIQYEKKAKRKSDKVN